MIIDLKFDQDESSIYVPDGYIEDIEELQDNFLNWIISKNQSCICYNSDDFLRYLNTVVLSGNEIAFYKKSKNKKRHVTIAF
ncbi:MAG: hypothetical protein SOR38_03415 [Oscillospiraceae bacterium]|nr:hypothetical protein [Oscillospiraceae bacterium]